MSKNNNNRKKGKGRVELPSDSESINDVNSIWSSGSYEDEFQQQSDDSQLVTTVEKYEEKLLQSLENATEKSAQTRTNAVQSICEILQHKFIPDFVEDRKITIMDIAEKSLRRGKGLEQEWAARLAPLLIIQLGGDSQIAQPLSHLLLTTVQNRAVSLSVREWACNALGTMTFLNCEDIGEIISTMQQCEQIFAGSYLKGDKTSPTITDEMAQLHVAALGAWGLLATLIPSGDFCSYINNANIGPSIANLIGLLKSPHVEIRMTAGEIIALILECGRLHDSEFLEEQISDLIDITSELSKDSQKFRGKKERKAQRASFRDVLRYLEEDISPEIQIRFGKENLLLDTWSINIQYQKLCDIIGPGITKHLAENEFLRDILQLGPKLAQTIGSPINKQTKLERHLLNAAAFKARTLSLRKNRDKRSVL